jgi:tRNA(Ile)-lysidine synthase
VLRWPAWVELDAHGIDLPLHVRFSLPGDRFHGLGAPGSKGLTRFLADAGVPRDDRARIPLVFAGPELVWVAGIRPCESRRVRASTRRRLRLVLHHPAAEPGAAARARQGGAPFFPLAAGG